MSHPDSKRALRRHHYERMKAKVRRLNRDVYHHGEVELARAEASEAHWTLWGRWANDIVWCSGICCGNPRRHFGELSVQEQRANQDRFDED